MPRNPSKKTKRVRVTEYEEPNEEQSEAEEFEADPGDLQVQSILESIGPGDIKIKILKWGPKGKSYCFSLDGGPVDEDFIQQQYGGGRYQGQIFRNGIYTGHSFELNIAERLATASGVNGGMADMQMRFMQQQIDLLKEIALGNRNQQQTPVGELAEAVKSVYALSGGGGSSMQGEKVVELLLKGVELGKTLGAKDESWSDVVREALPVVGEIMQQKRNGQAQSQQGAEVQERKELPAQDHDAVIRQGIAYLKGKALTGRDPGLYVDWMIDNADEPQYQPILHFILTSEFSAFEQIDPEIGKPPFVDFFRSLYDGLRSAFSGQDSMDVDTGRESGNDSDAGGNGKTRSGGPKSNKATG